MEKLPISIKVVELGVVKDFKNSFLYDNNVCSN